MKKAVPVSESRSFNMSKIHGKDTKPETTVRLYLFSHGFRYRKNDKRLPGKPDIVLSRYRTVVFVNGCFWHGHGCHYFTWPKHNADFWKSKIEETVKRDTINRLELENNGWRVITIWECNLKDRPEETLATLIDEITST